MLKAAGASLSHQPSLIDHRQSTMNDGCGYVLLYNAYAQLQIKCLTLMSVDTTCGISSPNPMFDHLLESSRWADSNKWSNIEFGEITAIIEEKNMPYLEPYKCICTHCSFVMESRSDLFSSCRMLRRPPSPTWASSFCMTPLIWLASNMCWSWVCCSLACTACVSRTWQDKYFTVKFAWKTISE